MSLSEEERGRVRAAPPMVSGSSDMSLLALLQQERKRIARLGTAVKIVCQPRCNGGDEGLRGDRRDKMKQAAGGSEGGNSLVGLERSVRRMKSSRR